jgi:tetrapyrrole methylase family protein/MazG family protein
MTDYPTEHISAISEAFSALYRLVLYLRSEQGCPWDRAQDLDSMFECLREETGELGDEIKKKKNDGITEEWGDAFFILLMLAVIGEEAGSFDTQKALRLIEAKMIRRHPHVFGSTDVDAVDEAIRQWDDIKIAEKGEGKASLMDDVPVFYSALKRADHVQKTAAEVGFDWPDCEGVLAKIEEETGELREAIAAGDTRAAAAELGDLLFSCVNLARFARMDSESLLSKTIDKFIKRFKYVESQLRQAGKSPDEATLDEMDVLWEKAKTQSDGPGARGESD